MTSNRTGITKMSLIVLAVSDQDRSIAFYESVGLEKRVDQPFGGDMRWVEVYAPDSATGIALAPPPGGEAVTPRRTGITFQTDDIDHTHAVLREQGVDVDAEVVRLGAPIPHMFWFRDPDGYGLLVVELRE